MNITLELFYTRGYARWEQDSPPVPLSSVTLANDLSRTTVLIGRDRRTIEDTARIQSRNGYPVIIMEVTDSSSSRGASPVNGLSSFALRVWWSAESGVQIQRESAFDKCPIAVRVSGCRNPRELEPDEIYASNANEVVVRIGSEGFWLRTEAHDAPTIRQPDTSDLSGTDPVFLGAQDAMVAHLSCPEAPGDAAHLLAADVTCPTPHRQLRRSLCSLMSYCLPQLAWPPEGWYFPRETQDTRLARNEALLGTVSNPTKDTSRLLEALSEFTSLRFRPDDTPMIVDLAVKYGWFPQHFWHDATRYVEALAPVDWSTAPP